jgi:hypothetical protein
MTMRDRHGTSNMLVRVAVAFHIVIFFLNLDVLSFVVRPDLLPRYWHAASILLAGLVVATARGAAKPLVCAMTGWLVLYVCAVLVSSIPADVPFAQFAYSNYVLYTISAILPALIVFGCLSSEDKSWLRPLMLMVFLVAWASIVADYFLPFRAVLQLVSPDGSDVVSVDRAAGAFLNPNGAAISMSLMIACMAYLWKSRWNSVFVVLALVAVLLTYSRAGLVSFLLIVGIMAWRGQLPRGLSILGVGLLIGVAYWMVVDDVLRSENTMDRLRFFASRDIADILASDERFLLLQKALVEIAEAPLFGHGWGYSKFWGETIAGQGTHNMYLSGMMDFGVLGLLVWPAWCLSLLWGPRQQRRSMAPVALVFLVYGLFTHNALESHAFLVPVILLLSFCRDDGAPRMRP